MKKTLFLISLLITCKFLVAQTINTPEKINQKGFAKIDFLSIDMPITNVPNEPNMGFTGIHYNLLFNNTLYTGIGLYGSVSGSRGGFFTLGVNAGIKKNDQFYQI